MELLKQIRIAVVGLPDSGKSTLIEHILKEVVGRTLKPDTLMNEVHWSDGTDPSGNPDTRTIKCAKIFFKYKDIEFCMYDCPGHLEYSDQIHQGISSAHCILKLYDFTRLKESKKYYRSLNLTKKPLMELYSHATENVYPNYNVELPGFKDMCLPLIDSLYETYKYDAIDVEQEALKFINSTINPDNNTVMFFSGGKDSLVGLDLVSRTDKLKHIKIFLPVSGYDFPEVTSTVLKQSCKYGKPVWVFDNSGGEKYEDVGPYKMLQNKAEANDKIIRDKNIDMVLIQYRASDEGVRSKDEYLVRREGHYRFSPVFYFSETNIWRYISKHRLEVCPLYFKGYRSLGDKVITAPCMPEFTTVDEIIDYIDTHPETSERDGRVSQDKSEDFVMEKLRNIGFF